MAVVRYSTAETKKLRFLQLVFLISNIFKYRLGLKFLSVYFDRLNMYLFFHIGKELFDFFSCEDSLLRASGSFFSKFNSVSWITCQICKDNTDWLSVFLNRTRSTFTHFFIIFFIAFCLWRKILELDFSVLLTKEGKEISEQSQIQS